MQFEMKIALFQLGWLGDSVMTVPSMWILRNRFPRARVIRVINSRMSDFFEGCPYVDEVIPFDRETHKVHEGMRLLMRLRESGVHAFFNLHTPDFDRPFRHYFRDNFFAFLTRARIRAAYVHSVDAIFVTNPVSIRDFGGERMDREMLKVVEAVVGRVCVEYRDVSFWVSEEEVRDAKRLLAEVSITGEDEFFAVAPFAKRPSKEWEAVRWGEVIRKLVGETGMKAVILGSPSDSARVEKIIAAAGGTLPSLVGRTSIKQAAGVLKGARLLLSVDSGLAHLAALMGVPSVVLFGPTDVERWRPIGEKGVVEIVRGEAECAPCFAYDCDDRICMESITTEAVLKAVNSALEAV